MITKMSKCFECYHWEQDGTEPYQGHCKLYSINCITAVFNGKAPTSFLAKDDVESILEPKLKGGEKRVKGELIFMNDEYLVKAAQSKRLQNPIYPDMREPTDESKKMIRKWKRERK